MFDMAPVKPGQDLTEECFQRTPLSFVRAAHRLLWNNGSLITTLGEERGVFVSGVIGLLSKLR